MKELEVAITLILAVSGIITATNWKKISPLARVLALLAIVGSVVSGFNAFKQIKHDDLIERINAKVGDIADNGSEYVVPRFEIGNSGSILINRTGVWIAGKDGPLFKVRMIKGRLLFTALVRNNNGVVVAAVDDNTWTRFGDEFEYNNDDSSFEIVTQGDRRLFFHVRLSGGIAHIEGILYSQGYLTYLFASPYKSKPGAIMYMQPSNAPIVPLPFVKPYFKYPREKYLGVPAE